MCSPAGGVAACRTFSKQSFHKSLAECRNWSVCVYILVFTVTIKCLGVGWGGVDCACCHTSAFSTSASMSLHCLSCRWHFIPISSFSTTYTFCFKWLHDLGHRFHPQRVTNKVMFRPQLKHRATQKVFHYNTVFIALFFYSFVLCTLNLLVKRSQCF